MNNTSVYTVCFFGHRTIEVTDTLKNEVYNVVENLIVENKIYIFLFGSKSKFNSLCYEIVTKLKIKYPYIKRVYVRAEFPYIDEDYKKYLLEKYEYTYYPKGVFNSGKLCYVKRNYEMIEKSEICIVYYNENYELSLKNPSKKSGTKIAYEYAIKSNKKCVNLFPKTLV